MDFGETQKKIIAPMGAVKRTTRVQRILSFVTSRFPVRIITRATIEMKELSIAPNRSRITSSGPPKKPTIVDR